MLVSMNWINDYVDLTGEKIEELIHRFTLSTAEVEEIYYKGKDIDGVIVAQIVSVENHPDSKKLHLLKVDTGSEILDIVCGAPNVSVGQKVALATVGAHVLAGEISAAKIAGYDSYGMCCSADELGLSDDHKGLMEIDCDAPLGTDIKKIYPIDDIIFEVDNKSLTNRPDLWGHYGIAREFAALTGKKLRQLDLSEIVYDGDKIIPVTITREDLVYRYSCIEMSAITKKTSPLSMRIRLYYCGMRGINLLADLTNYIMLELGQPTHAFDARKISAISIGTPEEQFTFKTLDGNDRIITPETLMIKNGNEPVAIAGIMGGLDSEIIGDTDSVVLESANFDGVSVRKSSSRLGLRTDASMRYEKVLDPELTVLAAKRFIRLLTSIDPNAKISSKFNDVYVNHYPVRTITFDKKFVDKYTGIDISADQIVRTLSLLGFSVESDGIGFKVTVPSWRATKDVTIKADIIEEITRIYGYDNFEIKTTDSLLKPIRTSVEKDESDAIKDILVQRYSMHEVNSYIWQDGKKYKKLGIDVEDNVRILNIATPENGTLRKSMFPTMLTFISENKSFAPTYSIFEIARVVDGKKENGECNERPSLSFATFSKDSSEKNVFLNAANIIRSLFREIKHCEPEFVNVTPRYPWQHPKNTVAVCADGKEIGILCTLHPSNLAKIDKNAAVAACEIFLDNFNSVNVENITYSEPSKFPGIDIDLSLVMKDGTKFDTACECWKKYVGKEISCVNVIDSFDIDKSSKSITVRLTFSSEEHTLSMEEIQPKVDSIISDLAEKGILIRS